MNRAEDAPRVVGLRERVVRDLLALLNLAELEELDDGVAEEKVDRGGRRQGKARGAATGEAWVDSRVLGGAEDSLELLLGGLAELAGGSLGREEDVIRWGARRKEVA